ncbi:ABC transporter permease [Bacillus niameyensis]|uniref:ABC transporter permease n=1 Tax=Bacillus niameyensis TaxID=1522308 RepID=UPI0007811C53|nr:ABC transporter permease [Bacillus niameyensis]
MTFSQIVWKMAKAHYKKYLFYFLCNSFAVMFFFMFSTVYFNEQISEAKQLDGVQDALKIPTAALIVFTIFFIYYAHFIFMKQRKSEFALFMTLGMSNRDISKLLLLENGVIALSSIITGIIGGTVFSRLFFLVLINSVGLQAVSFHLTSNMFLYSIIAFVIVFFIAAGNSLFLTLRRNIAQNLKSDKVAETNKMKSPLIGGIGLAFLTGSLLFLYLTYSDSSGEYLFMWTIGVFTGLYISLYQSISLFIELFKRNKGFYFRKLLLLASLEYKFKQLTSLFMLITVMVMITILYSSLLLTFYNLSEKEAIEINPYDVAFLQTETKNFLPEDEVGSILNNKEHLVIPIYYYYEKSAYQDLYERYSFIPVNEFNKLTSTQKSLEDGEFIHYINDHPENIIGLDEYSETLTFGEESYKMKEKIAQSRINLFVSNFEYIVVSPADFESLKHQLDGFEANLHLINLDNWKSSAAAVEELSEKFKLLNASSPPFIGTQNQYMFEEDFFQVASKVENYNFKKNSNGLLFFVTTFLSILFFFGSFVLLYLNLFSDIDKEKLKYKKLTKIGITSQEVKKTISQELMALFFIPTITGIILAFLYIVIMATDIGGITQNPVILAHFFIIAGIYFCIQVGAFLFARRKMASHIIGS